MRRAKLAGLFLVLGAPWASADVLFGPASLSDDNGGLFLSGASIATAGSIFTLTLPNYGTSSTFGFPPDEVDLGLTISSSEAEIVGIQYTFFGAFTGLGDAQFVQTAGSDSDIGSFSTASYTGQFLFAAATNTFNLTTQLNLNDGGDTAAITKIQFQVLTPEPATLPVSAALFGVILLLGFLRARRSA